MGFDVHILDFIAFVFGPRLHILFVGPLTAMRDVFGMDHALLSWTSFIYGRSLLCVGLSPCVAGVCNHIVIFTKYAPDIRCVSAALTLAELTMQGARKGK